VIVPGEVVSYLEMCREEGVNLQRGMNYRLRPDSSVVLMSVRPGAPYADRIEEDGHVLIYEGHDRPRTREGPDPKTVDQPMRNPNGSLTENGKFYEAAHKGRGGGEVELVRVGGRKDPPLPGTPAFRALWRHRVAREGAFFLGDLTL
jgi:hypothetical protein